MSVRATLLQALLHGDGSGTDLIRRVHHLTESRVRLNYGCVYPALHAMESEGLLHSYDGCVTGRGGRRHRRYRLKTMGTQEAHCQQEVMKALLPRAASAEPKRREGLVRPTS
jgi:DNA-binding PadR family transcriptional regulator